MSLIRVLEIPKSSGVTFTNLDVVDGKVSR